MSVSQVRSVCLHEEGRLSLPSLFEMKTPLVDSISVGPDLVDTLQCIWDFCLHLRFLQELASVCPSGMRQALELVLWFKKSSPERLDKNPTNSCCRIRKSTSSRR